MKSGHHLRNACLAALVAVTLPVVSIATETAVVAQDLMNVRASNRIAAALWTRRPDSYTLQLVFVTSGSRVLPMTDGRRMVASSTPTQFPGVPETRVWLLRADGRQVMPIWYTPAATNQPEPCVRSCGRTEKLYRFSLADSVGAVAMVIRINDEFYIEKLESLVLEPVQ